MPKLSERQHQVLRCLASGASDKEIARALGIAPRTVSVHMQALFKALGVHRRLQAVLTAQSKGIV